MDNNPITHYMAKQQRNSGRRYAAPVEPSPFEQARDELFQHIMRCGVVGAEPGWLANAAANQIAAAVVQAFRRAYEERTN